MGPKPTDREKKHCVTAAYHVYDNKNKKQTNKNMEYTISIDPATK
jgi:hypothetical protein